MMTRWVRTTTTALVLSGLATTGLAQQQPTPPGLRFGVTTGFTAHDNRGLDQNSLGSTYELFTRLDFGATFATGIQTLDLSGDITLRGLNGAEEDDIADGIVDPNLRLSYARVARNAQLDVTAFVQQSETISLTDDFDLINLERVTEEATRLRYGFDTELELRRQAPFGITLSTGYTALRYSNTSSTTLTDQDRYRLGASFRFDINASTRATLDARFSTFEDDGTAEGRRDTFALNGSWRQTVANGSLSFRTGITATEDGERYSLSAERNIKTALWDITGSLGASQSVDGDIFPIGSLRATYTRPLDSFSANLSRQIQSGSDDEEQEVTTLGLTYQRQLSAATALNMDLSFRENDPTGPTASSSLSTFGINVQHTLAPGWQMTVGLNRRISDSSTTSSVRDNSLSLSVRRNLSALR